MPRIARVDHSMPMAYALCRIIGMEILIRSSVMIPWRN